MDAISRQSEQKDQAANDFANVDLKALAENAMRLKETLSGLRLGPGLSDSPVPPGVSQAPPRLTPEEEIRQADIIVVALSRREGDMWKCIVNEVLKDNPADPFPIKPGEEYSWGNRAVEGGTHVGDGQVMFFRESSNSYQSAVSFYDRWTGGFFGSKKRPSDQAPKYRIPARGDMALDDFKNLVIAAAK